MSTQKERAKWFKDLYNTYVDKFNEQGEVGDCAMDEVDFKDRVTNMIEEQMESVGELE